MIDRFRFRAAKVPLGRFTLLVKICFLAAACSGFFQNKFVECISLRPVNPQAGVGSSQSQNREVESEENNQSDRVVISFDDSNVPFELLDKHVHAHNGSPASSNSSAETSSNVKILNNEQQSKQKPCSSRVVNPQQQQYQAEGLRQPLLEGRQKDDTPNNSSCDRRHLDLSRFVDPDVQNS